MDTFGRLTTDVLKQMQYLYQLPSIEFDPSPKFIIMINYIMLN